jgi:anti-sigma factor RsiW
MNPCDDYRVKILRYLDDDLQGHELTDFRSHLNACTECRASLEAEQTSW